MRLQTIILSAVLFMSINLSAHTKERTTVQNKTASASIYCLPPFERAVLVIQHYETFHINKYPYIGYGNRIQKGEKLTSNITLIQCYAHHRYQQKNLSQFLLQYGQE